MTPDALLSDFVTLFVVVDPLGTTPIFIALLAGASSAERRRVAFTSVGLGTAILLVFALTGQTLLDAIGITIPAFRIAGGVLLFLTSIEMILQRRNERRSGAVDDGPGDDPTVFPLAIQFIAGPGAITTIILLAGDTGGDPLRFGALVGVLAAVMGLTLILFLLASRLRAYLNRTVTDVLTRLLGLLLAALSVQFILDGVADYARAGF